MIKIVHTNYYVRMKLEDITQNCYVKYFKLLYLQKYPAKWDEKKMFHCSIIEMYYKINLEINKVPTIYNDKNYIAKKFGVFVCSIHSGYFGLW